MSYDTKLTNPKDAIGSTKLPMHLVPSTVMTYASLGFLEGALKYGKFNWRAAGVRFSIYLDAIDRHLAKLKNGEWADPVTDVPHLASVICCAGIIADAKLCDKLNDDRPPTAPVSEHIDSLVPAVAKLKDMFKDHHPHQHTIADGAAEAKPTSPAERIIAYKRGSVDIRPGDPPIFADHGKAVGSPSTEKGAFVPAFIASPRLPHRCRHSDGPETLLEGEHCVLCGVCERG